MKYRFYGGPYDGRKMDLIQPLAYVTLAHTPPGLTIDGAMRRPRQPQNFMYERYAIAVGLIDVFVYVHGDPTKSIIERAVKDLNSDLEEAARKLEKKESEVSP